MHTGVGRICRISLVPHHVEEIVGKVLFDHLPLVTAANNKIAGAVRGIYFHEMQKNRLYPDLQHWLRLEVGLLENAGSQPPGKNHGFHFLSRRTRQTFRHT